MKEALYLIIIFLFIIGLAYFITKKLALLGNLAANNKNLKLLETLQVGMGQYIHLVQVGEKLVTISVSKEGVRYLCEIDAADIDLSVYNLPNKTTSFEQYFKKWTKK